MNEIIVNFVDQIALGVGLVGVAIVVWGIGMAIIGLIRLEFRQLRGVSICRQREYLRHHLGQYLLLGLEFLVAADIIHTVFNPDLQALITLGAIVAIRTVISFFLNRELEGAHDCVETEETKN